MPFSKSSFCFPEAKFVIWPSQATILPRDHTIGRGPAPARIWDGASSDHTIGDQRRSAGEPYIYIYMYVYICTWRSLVCAGVCTIHAHISCEDPFEHSRNVGLSLSPHGMSVTRDELARAASLCARGAPLAVPHAAVQNVQGFNACVKLDNVNTLFALCVFNRSAHSARPELDLGVSH